MNKNDTKIQLEKLQDQRLTEKSESRKKKIEFLRLKIVRLEKEVDDLELLERKAQQSFDQSASSPVRSSLKSRDPIALLRDQTFQP